MTDLIVMRLADMHRVHPQQITAHCAVCGHEVGVYPSGQAIMAQEPNIRLVCHVCRPRSGMAMLAPGAEAEPAQSVNATKGKPN